MIGAVSRKARFSTGAITVFCLALGGLIAAEWFDRQHPAEGPLAPPADKAIGAAQSANFAMPPLATYGEVLSRPLFSASRRPTEKASVAQADPRSIRLIGIVIPSHRIPHALIRHGTPPELDRVEEGGTIENWTVEAIKNDRVILHDGDGTLVLVPVDGPQLPPAAPPNHPPPAVSEPPRVAAPPRPTPPLPPQRAG